MVRRAVGARGEEAAQGREVRVVIEMDRAELIAHLGEQIVFIKENVPAEHGRNAAIRNMRAIRKGLETYRSESAVEGAERFLHDIEDRGGVARGTRVGPKDEVPAIIYSSEASKQNHWYAQWLLETVRKVTGIPSPVKAKDASEPEDAPGAVREVAESPGPVKAEGVSEPEAAPKVVTAEEWQRAFDVEGPG